MHQKTTGITLDLANQESIERRIVAKNLKDPNDRTPVLTVQEAIIKSFGADSTNGNIVYEDEQTRRKFNISEKEVAVIVDKQIEAEINKQITDNGIKKLYDVKITPEMNIHIISKEVIREIDEEEKETSVILYDDPNSLSWKIKHDNLFSDRVITENNLKNIGKANAISFINPP
ncbi:hypothetical protein BH747_09940 [Enterococcus villorum]|uniref:Clostridial binary toxin B/anthrax toxin PA domain-containing protein n=1 Tax=Enterococcus villorum TaxID=112904 RepID=A0A1V8YAC5_9ENTE|nr:hypothetical protein [Enterococcus villorum]OQO69581.1 hypothetical protein BH747_09940 [Enterococcus villorum]OQO72667.1 hypothetical protein BH744_11160 [Enterococcus villorum]